MVAERHQQQQLAGKVAAFNLAGAGFGDRPDLDDDGRERRTGNAASSTIPPAACACIYLCSSTIVREGHA